MSPLRENDHVNATTTNRAGRLRVLWLIKGLGPGGAEQLLLLSARVVDRRRFDYRVAFLRPDKTHLVEEFNGLGLGPVRLGAGARSARLAWPGQLRRLMAGADVVHSHSPVLASVARLVALTLPAVRRPAVVYTEHSEWTGHQPATRWSNALTAPLDDYHWAVSDQVRATVWPRLRDSYHVLIHGIDTAQIAPSEDLRSRVRGELGVRPEEILVITVANLRKPKDYPNLLAAAKLAVAADPRIRFVAVGQGPLDAELRARHAASGLGDRFQFLGFRRDVHDLLESADIFVLASSHEGLPVALMEALARGLPIVATAVGGIPDAITEGREGFLVPSGDAHALGDALLQLAGDSAVRERMSEAAIVRSRDYDIRTAVSEQQRVYAELAQRRRRSR